MLSHTKFRPVTVSPSNGRVKQSQSVFRIFDSHGESRWRTIFDDADAWEAKEILSSQQKYADSANGRYEHL